VPLIGLLEPDRGLDLLSPNVYPTTTGDVHRPDDRAPSPEIDAPVTSALMLGPHHKRDLDRTEVGTAARADLHLGQEASHLEDGVEPDLLEVSLPGTASRPLGTLNGPWSHAGLALQKEDCTVISAFAEIAAVAPRVVATPSVTVVFYLDISRVTAPM
jgi:hypothetical protein